MSREEMDGEIRIVVGVDGSDACGDALGVCRRLQFGRPQRYLLVNAVESMLPDGSFPPFRYAHPLASELREREEAGKEKLRSAHAKLSEGVVSEEFQAHGDPSEALLRIAGERGADLIVVGHNRRGALDDLVLGSVARRLLRESPHHLLVTRPTTGAGVGLNAVIAFDDSPESERCIEAFIRLAPKGVDKVYVLTVNEIDSGAASMLVRGLPHLQRKAERWIAEGLEKDGRRICERLQSAGFDAEPLMVEGGDTAAAIRQACDATRSSLLAIAARPHGFWDRFWHGSVSEEIFARDSRSLLVLRPHPERPQGQA